MKQHLFLTLLFLSFFQLAAQELTLSFAIINSPQGNSPARAVSLINQKKATATLFLGDLAEQDENLFFSAIFHLNCLQMPLFTLAGDKDFSLFPDNPQEAISALMMNNSYYCETFSFSEKEQWKLIFLDGGKVSLFAWKKDSIPYNYAKNQLKKYPNASPKSGALGDEQRFWLEKELDRATALNEKVIILCHFPLLPEQGTPLWDHQAVYETIKNQPCLKGWISDSETPGLIKQGKLFFLGLKRLGKNDPNFLLLKIFSEKIEVEGFGEEESWIILH